MKTKELLFKILRLLSPYRISLFIAGISLLAVVSCLLTIGFVIRHFIDNQLDPQDHSMLYLMILITIFGIASFLRSFLINSTAEFAANDAKKQAFTTLLRMNPAILDQYSFSDLSSRINSDSEYISRVIIDVTSFFIRNIMTTSGGIILMFYNSVKLSVVAFVTISIITFLSTTLSKKVRLLAKKAEIAKSKTSNLVFESIINNKVVNAFGAQDLLTNYFSKLNLDAKEKVTLRLKYRSIFFASVITSMLLTISGIIWYGSIEVLNGNISSGTLASFLFYAFMTTMSFGGIIEMMSDLEKNLTNCERFFEVFVKSENKPNTLDSINIGRGDISLQNISYYYNKENNKEIFNDLSVKFKSGKFSVITGRSGSGKTTILNLIMGLYQPNKGSIYIGDQKFDQIFPSNWQKKLAYVPQDNMLFSGSIIENISFFEIKPDIEKIKHILDGLDLSDFIKDLPEGLNSEIGSLASKVSGGQRQRIAIARAIYSNPEILILDESTSQLDEKTESKVIDFIKKSMSGKTTICVAHRRGAIDKADEVVEI